MPNLLPPSLRSLARRPLPAGVGWWHTLGALLLAYLLVQGITGLLLATYYNPSPENAYASLGYVRDEVFLGSFVQALHRDGAGFVLVAAALHLSRLFFTAGYRGSGARSWWIALGGFAVLTLFPFTGMLLPLDQKGYWATVIGLDVAGAIPGIGDTVGDLLTGGGDVTGPITLSRFHLLHVSVLPIVLLGLVGAYLRTLLRWHPPLPAERGAPPPTFFPVQTARIAVVVVLGFVALALASTLGGDAVVSPADPGDESFFPYPEWYFLPAYQVLRILPGSWQWVGTVYVPLAFLALLALPLVDRGANERSEGPSRWRLLLRLGGGAGIVATVGLGLAAGMHVRANRTDLVSDVMEETEDASDAVAAGRAVYLDSGCANCHLLHGEGQPFGPELTGLSRRLRPEFLDPFLRNPAEYFVEASMPPWDGTDEELALLISFLLAQ